MLPLPWFISPQIITWYIIFASTLCFPTLECKIFENKNCVLSTTICFQTPSTPQDTHTHTHTHTYIHQSALGLQYVWPVLWITWIKWGLNKYLSNEWMNEGMGDWVAAWTGRHILRDCFLIQDAECSPRKSFGTFLLRAPWQSHTLWFSSKVSYSRHKIHFFFD